MLVEQVDAIRFQSLERSVRDRSDPLRAAINPGHRISILEAEFRGDDYLVADRGQRLTHDFLIHERPVRFGRIKESDARFERRTDQ